MMFSGPGPEMRMKSRRRLRRVYITLDKMPAFLAEKSKAYIEDAKAAGLLK